MPNRPLAAALLCALAVASTAAALPASGNLPAADSGVSRPPARPVTPSTTAPARTLPPLAAPAAAASSALPASSVAEGTGAAAAPAYRPDPPAEHRHAARARKGAHARRAAHVRKSRKAARARAAHARAKLATHHHRRPAKRHVAGASR